jgi:hypothetical protein
LWLALAGLVARLAIDDEGPLVIGENRDLAAVVVVVQVLAAKHEVPQHAAKGLLQVLLGEGRRSGRRPGRCG